MNERFCIYASGNVEARLTCFTPEACFIEFTSLVQLFWHLQYLEVPSFFRLRYQIRHLFE